jgi:hypothetical protein
VWDETRRIYEELMQSAGWRDAQQVIMDDVGSVTGKVICFQKSHTYLTHPAAGHVLNYQLRIWDQYVLGRS